MAQLAMCGLAHFAIIHMQRLLAWWTYRGDVAQKRKEEHGLEALVSTELKKTLEQTKADVVFNCIIPAVHYDVTLTALKHGCHVLSEKPMAESMSEAKTMMEAARAAGKLFVVMQIRVDVPVYPDVSERLEGHAAVIYDFLTAIETGTTPKTVCSDNIKSLAMVYGALESAEKGDQVAVF
ncbi:MAG: Gfo/Idh/MocA family protein [Trueperaceae bacterium]